MRIVLTGCNGKLGRPCSELFTSRGHEVVGIDAAAGNAGPIPVIVDDLRNPATIHRAFDKLGSTPDAVVHLANHTNSLVAPMEVVLRENLSMNTSVFIAAAQAGVARIVFASSIQAFMANAENDGAMGQRMPHALPLSEAVPPRPSNVYGVSKLLTEKMLDQMCDPDTFRLPGRPPAARLTAVSVRLPFILSAPQYDSAVKNTFPSDFRWGGPEAFAYIHAEDAAEAMLAAATARIDRHEVVWVSAADPRPAETVAQLVAKHYQAVPGAEECIKPRRLSDCSKAHRLLGWSPKHNMAKDRAKAGLTPAGEA